jgi:hypothetical protein
VGGVGVVNEVNERAVNLVNDLAESRSPPARAVMPSSVADLFYDVRERCTVGFVSDDDPMQTSCFFLSLLLASTAFAGCADPSASSDGDASESSESDIKKKVKPTGGNGALDLQAPAFAATNFSSGFTFDNQVLAVGGRAEKTPGSYALRAMSSWDGGNRLMQEEIIPMTAGTIVARKVAGLRVRFAEPVTLGGATVNITPTHGWAGTLAPNAAWRAAPKGVSMLVLPDNLRITTDADAAPVPAVTTSGALTEIVLPTARVEIAVDAIDPAYPSPPAPCNAPYIFAGAMGSTVQAEFVRKPDSSGASFVVPQGGTADLELNAYGIRIRKPTTGAAVHTITLNRLEIDDVAVAQAGGGSTSVRGTVTISRKDNASWQAINCTFPTHTGVDLPDGTYRVITTAQSASGPITHTEEVSFP